MKFYDPWSHLLLGYKCEPKKVNQKNEPFAKLRPGFMRDNGHGLLREDKVNCGGK